MTASRVRDLALTGFIIDGKPQRAKGKDERVKNHERTENHEAGAGGKSPPSYSDTKLHPVS